MSEKRQQLCSPPRSGKAAVWLRKAEVGSPEGTMGKREGLKICCAYHEEKRHSWSNLVQAGPSKNFRIRPRGASLRSKGWLPKNLKNRFQTGQGRRSNSRNIVKLRVAAGHRPALRDLGNTPSRLRPGRVLTVSGVRKATQRNKQGQTKDYPGWRGGGSPREMGRGFAARSCCSGGGRTDLSLRTVSDGGDIRLGHGFPSTVAMEFLPFPFKL